MSRLQSNFSNQDVEILSREECHAGFLRVERLMLRHRLHAGDWSEILQRELLLKAPAVGILLYDPVRDEVLLIRQFRVGMLDEQSNPWSLELVAGMVAEGEQLQEVAIREAEEDLTLHQQISYRSAITIIARAAATKKSPCTAGVLIAKMRGVFLDWSRSTKI